MRNVFNVSTFLLFMTGTGVCPILLITMFTSGLWYLFCYRLHFPREGTETIRVMATKTEPGISLKAKFIPTSINHESLFAGDTEGAAFQSGVPFEEMTEMEQRAFPDVRAGSKALKKIFFFIRNRFLQLWLQNPKQELGLELALAKLDPPYNSEVTLAFRIHAFMMRYGWVD